MTASLIKRLNFFEEMLRANIIFTRSALAVAFCLLYRHLNGRTGRCDPSIATLADETGLTKRSVKSAVDELRKSGWWRIGQGGGRGHTNSYLPQLEKVNSASPIRVGKGEPAFTVSPPERVKCSVKKGEACFTRTSKNQSPYGLSLDLRPVARPARSRVRSEPEIKNGASSEFETFWRIYPHRGGHPDPKKPARLKFEAAVKHGADPADMIRGARHYAAYVAVNVGDPRFITQAVTWINREQWTEYQDTPEPPALRVGMN